MALDNMCCTPHRIPRVKAVHSWTLKFLFILLFPTVSATDQIQEAYNGQERQETSESDAAFSMFRILLAHDDIFQYSDESADGHIIFKDGAVNDRWIESTKSSSDNVTASENIHCDNQYSDRISFDFFYGKFQEYDIATPTSTSSDSSIAKPKIVEFQNEPDEQAGSFSVVYDCQKNSEALQLKNVTISVVFPVVSGLSVLFQFQKTCGGGHHKFIEFGYYEESQYVPNEMSRALFRTNARPIIVGPHVMNTKLYLLLLHPARTQEFFHVSVKSSNPNLEITPKGPVFGGVLKRAESSIIHVLYECHGKGRYEVAATIPVHPFDDIRASWVKDCGGGLASGFNVGSDAWIKDDIVKAGVTSQRWQLGMHASSSDLGQGAPLVNSSVRTTDMWLSNNGFALQIAPAVITVEKPAILTVIAPDSYTRRSIYNMETNGLLPRGDRVRCRLRMICKKKGKSIVVVIFPIKSFTNVEVSFMKECRTPRRYVYSGFLRTASSVMMVVSLSMVFALAYWGRQLWKSGEIGVIDKPARGYRQV